MGPRRILISGAGIAGLALAYWLRKHGFDVTVVERASAQRVGGQAVDIRGAARVVLDRMGVLDEVRARHTGTRGIAYLDRSGRVRARLDNTMFGDSGGVIAELEILRDDLVRILIDAAGPHVEYLYGDTITRLDENADSVTVSFEDGSQREFDVVVGADGVHSNTRRLVFGDRSHFVQDLGYYSAYFTAYAEQDQNGWEYAYSMPGRRLAMTYPVGDVGELRAMLSFASVDRGVDRGDTKAQKKLLREVYSDGGWELPTLLEQLHRAEYLYFARVGGVRVSEWSRGRVVLMGDAISGGSLGMGTSMALVQAYVLAGELARSDHEIAFAAYRGTLDRYVSLNQKRPLGSNAGFLPRTATGIAARNLLLRSLPHIPGSGRILGGTQSSSALELEAFV